MALLAGCGEPSVDVVMLWVDGISDDRGDRQVRIYEDGERDTLAVVPDIPGTNIDLLQVGVDPRARGFALSGTDSTVWVERGSGRRVTLEASALGPDATVATGFSFTASGDAVMRRVEQSDAALPTWLLAPLSGPRALTVSTLTPPRATALHWSLQHAADAPVMVWAEVDTGSSQVIGELDAVAYPSALGQGPVVDELRPLGRGALVGRAVSIDASRYLPGCPFRLCVAPSGRQVFTMVDGSGCDLWRWSWVEAESTHAVTPPERVPLACPVADDEPAMLTAVLDDDLVVLDDARRLYLADLTAGRVSSIPKPPGTLSPQLVAQGHVLVVGSSEGELLRIDADGPRMLSGIQSPCLFPNGPAVSPSGAWVVQTCAAPTGGASGLGGQVRRISVLGVELYTGIPMRPIAVDDDGNALLFSVSPDDDDEVPRGLFVLTGDGQLTRVDELEPSPGRVMLPGVEGERTLGRFSVAGP
ncbi:MAG: hypothetical protein KDK70_21995, partial [Myxococcales bacterium]|nr:hypothetical protein [Myxococcales bacterium]